MRKIIVLLLLIFVSDLLPAQEVAHLKPDMFIGIQEIQLAQLDGWKFKPGNDADWAKNNTDISTWQTLKPTQLSKAMADENGRVEGWFKLKVKLDESFGNQQLGIRFYCWAAVDLYIDGKFINSFGNTGAKGKPYEEFNPSERLPIPVPMKGANEYVIAFHFVDVVAAYPAFGIKSNQTGLDQFIKLTGPEYHKTFGNYLEQQPVYFAVSMSICSVLILLFLLLALQNKREKFLWLIVLFMLFVCLSDIFSILTYGQKLGFYQYKWALMIGNIIGSLPYLIIPIILCSIFKRKIGWDLKCYLFLNGFSFCLGLIPFYQELLYLLTGLGCSIYYLISVRKTLKNAPTKTILAAVFKSLRVFLAMTAVFMSLMYIYQAIVPILMIVVLLLVSAYIVFSSWKTATSAQWAIIIGILLSFLFLVVGLGMSISYATTIFPYSRFINVAITLSFPLSLLVYVALRFKEILGEVVALSEEKNEILLMQNERLEHEVSARTSELNQSMQELKATQSQLIQSEKMASLGELTAGIAHEIQNPLNFVNNFSEVSVELLDEMETEIEKGDFEEVKAISSDIKQNLEKISHHGKRADSIVKGMLQHSRSSSSNKEPTDINKLVDEYLRLAYHGLRAKDNSFNAELITNFDASLPKVEVIPQDVGRVFLNLFTNAFYATQDKSRKLQSKDYKQQITVTTFLKENYITISVKDNGTGISEAIKDKILQPFFTTKPTGEGTGLGLSLSYDIIVKAHGGKLNIETEEGQWSEFIIELPLKSI